MPHKKRDARKHKQRKPPPEPGRRVEKKKNEARAGCLDLMGDKPPYPVEG